MTELIPYFAALITLLFSAGFYLSVQELKKRDKLRVAARLDYKLFTFSTDRIAWCLCRVFLSKPFLTLEHQLPGVASDT